MNVKQFLKDHNVQHDVITHRSTYDAQRMAQTLHVPGREVAKTVLLRAYLWLSFIVDVLPATKHVDFSADCRALWVAKL
jgi:Ala-tRNA(Pro) deacylase